MGNGACIVAEVRYESEAERVWINTLQAFTGIPAAAWQWGQGFRPLEHYLDDGAGGSSTLSRLRPSSQLSTAVRESIRLEPALDASLEAIVVATLDRNGSSETARGVPEG